MSCVLCLPRETQEQNERMEAEIMWNKRTTQRGLLKIQRSYLHNNQAVTGITLWSDPFCQSIESRFRRNGTCFEHRWFVFHNFGALYGPSISYKLYIFLTSQLKPTSWHVLENCSFKNAVYHRDCRRHSVKDGIDLLLSSTFFGEVRFCSLSLFIITGQTPFKSQSDVWTRGAKYPVGFLMLLWVSWLDSGCWQRSWSSDSMIHQHTPQSSEMRKWN